MREYTQAHARHSGQRIMVDILNSDIVALQDQLTAADSDLKSLLTGLTPEQGTQRPAPGSWSIAQCLDHLATTNRIYISVMQQAADKGRVQGRMRKGPATPGLLGAWFIRSLEPPVKPQRRWKAPKSIHPRPSPELADAAADFSASQQQVRAFLNANADLDLTGILFPNPFMPIVRFSLATGLNNIAAHERRHLWQAWQVRRASERTAPRALFP
jgi:DinB superfamily